MIKILLVSLFLVQILSVSQLHRGTLQDNKEQQQWNWVKGNDLSSQQKLIEGWVRKQLPQLSAYSLSKVARSGDQLQFHYDGQGKMGWDVVVSGKGDAKFIKRATYISTEVKKDGTEIIKKKHIVRNDFIKSINEYA